MNLRPIWRGLVALGLVLTPSLGFAQGIPAFQSGLVTPGHLLKGAGNGQHMDVGGLTGDVNGRGVQPFSITDSLGLGLCTHSAATGVQHYEFCLGHNPNGDALLSLTANGGAIEKSAYLSKNGVLYEMPFVGAGSGNVVGPATSTVDTCALWNNVSGTALKTGLCVTSPGSTVSGNVPLWSNTTGTGQSDSGVPFTSLRQSAALNPTAREVFISATGSDSNDCLAATVTGGHGPCATFNAAAGAILGLDARQESVVVNYGPGVFTEPVAVNGAMPGLSTKRNFLGAATQPNFRIVGAGSGSTTLMGAGSYLGQNYCYAVLANDGARVTLKNLSIQADGPTGSCNVSDLFIQNATVYIESDVTLKAATGNHVSMEENALLYVTPGSTTPGLTLAGNAYNGINLDANSTFVSDSTVQISGAITYSGGCAINVAYQSVFKITIPSPAFTNGATVSGRRFCLDGLSNMVIGNPPATWFGSLGIVSNGSRYQAPDAVPCVGGAVGCPALSAPTGLGGGTAAISTGSGAYGGAVQLTGGAAAAASGGVNVGFPYEMNRGACAIWQSPGTGAWSARAGFATAGFTTDQGLAISWDNNAVALTNGSTYFIGWTCNTTQ